MISRCNKKKKYIWILIAYVLSANANDNLDSCFQLAAKKYAINERLLRAIALVESNFKQEAMNDSNRNGTADFGIMQINSTWFASLKDLGISEQRVKTDGCMNIFIGAWILANNFKYGGFNWNSVGAYNAGFSKSASVARERYIQKVMAALKKLKK